MTAIQNPFEKFQSLKKIDFTDLAELKKRFEALLEMKLDSREEVLVFQKERDLLNKYNVNEMAESYFLMTTDVANEEKKKRKEFYDQEITPLVKEYEEKLNQKFLASEVTKEMGEKFQLLRRNQQNSIDLFSKENLELEKEASRLDNEIMEIHGKLTARWNDEDVPIPALNPYFQSTDREVRKKAFEASLDADMKIFEEIDRRFDELLLLRQKIAKNAGFSSYTKYRFKEMERFDWDESHCFDFHKAVKKHIVPLRAKLLEKRKKLLNLDTVKPYDLSVDMYGRGPLQIYDKGKSQSLIDGCEKIIKAIDGELHKYFCDIRDANLLDLDSRENKAPGGYMVMYPIFEKASVFYNGVGLSYDLMVLLHELGHCFHYYLGKDVAPYSLQNWTSEVAEGGSMSMEFIGLEKMHEYLPKDQCARIKEERLMGIIGLLCGCAKGDEFQHWLYANPNHTSAERIQKWGELTSIYNAGIDYTGYEDVTNKTDWQFAHILLMPYYYIDYSISEILALSIWDRYKKNPEDGLKHYKEGCRLAASKTVPEIYKAFGTTLSFGEEVIGPLAKSLEGELGLG